MTNLHLVHAYEAIKVGHVRMPMTDKSSITMEQAMPFMPAIPHLQIGEEQPTGDWTEAIMLVMLPLSQKHISGTSSVW